MIKNTALFNETFGINKTNTYILSLQLSSNSYSYCILDTIRKRFVALKHENFDKTLIEKSYSEKIKSMLISDAFLNKNYKEVNFCFISPKSTIVPKDLFEKDNTKDYYKYNMELDEYEEVHFNKFKNSEAVGIFSLPSDVTTLLVNKFPGIKFFHQTCSLIEATFHEINKRKIKSPYIKVNFNQNFFDIVVTISSKLVLSNSYTFETETDAIYYLMNIVDKLNLQPLNTEFVFSGEIEETGTLFGSIKKYLTNSTFAEISGTDTYVFTSIPEHMFVNILNLSLCE